MTPRMFRPTEPAVSDSLPQLEPGHGSTGRKLAGLLAWGRPAPLNRRRLALLVHSLVLAVGVVVQVVLVILAGELVDLYVSSVELWAELARKHLELSLS